MLLSAYDFIPDIEKDRYAVRLLDVDRRAVDFQFIEKWNLKHGVEFIAYQSMMISGYDLIDLVESRVLAKQFFEEKLAEVEECGSINYLSKIDLVYQELKIIILLRCLLLQMQPYIINVLLIIQDVTLAPQTSPQAALAVPNTKSPSANVPSFTYLENLGIIK